jgi:hypothetical protein
VPFQLPPALHLPMQTTFDITKSRSKVVSLVEQEDMMVTRNNVDADYGLTEHRRPYRSRVRMIIQSYTSNDRYKASFGAINVTVLAAETSSIENVRERVWKVQRYGDLRV